MNRYLWGMGVLAVALLVSLAFGWALGVGLGRSGEVAAQGASTGNVIAIPSGEGYRLYLVDTEAKVILVYDSRSGKSGFSLVGGRSYEFDIEFARKSEIRFLQNGYDISKIDSELKKRERLKKR